MGAPQPGGATRRHAQTTGGGSVGRRRTDIVQGTAEKKHHRPRHDHLGNRLMKHQALVGPVRQNSARMAGRNDEFSPRRRCCRERAPRPRHSDTITGEKKYMYLYCHRTSTWAACPEHRDGPQYWLDDTVLESSPTRPSGRGSCGVILTAEQGVVTPATGYSSSRRARHVRHPVTRPSRTAARHPCASGNEHQPYGWCGGY